MRLMSIALQWPSPASEAFVIDTGSWYITEKENNMPWKLVFYLVLLGLILAFVGLNLGNTTDISFGFVSFSDVPVFMSLFVAFFFGVAVALPAAIRTSSRKTRARSERTLSRREKKQAKRAAKEEKKSRNAAKRTQDNPPAEIGDR